MSLWYAIEMPRRQEEALVSRREASDLWTLQDCRLTPPGVFDRIAGTITDMQYIVHHGFTSCDATF